MIKCTFGVPSEKLLSFIISPRGIKTNCNHIEAIIRMGPSQSLKDIQRLTSCIATLHRFISRLGERALPLFKLLKKARKIKWTQEVYTTFQQFKRFLTNPPILNPPKEGEKLILYLAATTDVVSSAIVVERIEEGHVFRVRRPVYFICNVLRESKVRYP